MAAAQRRVVTHMTVLLDLGGKSPRRCQLRDDVIDLCGKRQWNERDGGIARPSSFTFVREAVGRFSTAADERGVPRNRHVGGPGHAMVNGESANQNQNQNSKPRPALTL